jgi:phosphate transport system substrate-binding protein
MRSFFSLFGPGVPVAMVLALLGLANSARAEVVDLRIVGTGDGIDLLQALGSDFMEPAKSIRVEIPPSIGSGGGIAAVGAGKSVLGRVARKLTNSELASGIIYQPIAKLPSTFYIHPGVGVSDLTTDQLRGIYTGQITDWSQVGGAPLHIRVVRREDTDSTLTVLRQLMPGWKDLVITEKSKTATTTQDAIETVRDVEGAIGFGPYSVKLEPNVFVLKIDGRHPLNPAYPSSVELALIYKNETMTPPARAFIDYTNSTRAHAVISRLGSVPVRHEE